MGNGFPIDIILLAAIAVFFVLRLRNVLGKRTGHDEPPKYDPFKKSADNEASDEKVVHLPGRAASDQAPGAAAGPTIDIDDVVSDGAMDSDAASEPGDLASGLQAIKAADRDFDQQQFAGGAAAAFEMIVGAFAEGDTETLRPLLANDVYDDFAGAIQSREEQKHTLETTLIGIEQSEIIEAELQGKTAFVTVKFVSEQVNVTRDAAGEVIDGDANHVAKVTDIWTFARNTRSRDPNWALVATRSSN